MNIKDKLIKAGYSIESTGGNCSALVKHIDDNKYYMFTAETGHIEPYEYPALVGFYLNDDLNYSVMIPTEKALDKFICDVEAIYEI